MNFVPEEVRGYISSFVSINEVDENVQKGLELDPSFFINELESLGINPLQLLQQKRMETTNIMRIKDEKVIPILYEFITSGSTIIPRGYYIELPKCLNSLCEILNEKLTDTPYWVIKGIGSRHQYIALELKDTKIEEEDIWPIIDQLVKDFTLWDNYMTKNDPSLISAFGSMKTFISSDELS